jgi:hypothetical protein
MAVRAKATRKGTIKLIIKPWRKLTAAVSVPPTADTIVRVVSMVVAPPKVMAFLLPNLEAKAG